MNMDREFAEKVIELYAEYGNKLDKKDLRKHLKFISFMQEIRDRPRISTSYAKIANTFPKSKKMVY